MSGNKDLDLLFQGMKKELHDEPTLCVNYFALISMAEGGELDDDGERLLMETEIYWKYRAEEGARLPS